MTSQASLENKGKEEVTPIEGVERFESRKVFLPKVDIIEREKETLLFIDMPGVDDKTVEVSLEKNILTLKGKPQACVPEGLAPVYTEYEMGDFERSFTISNEVDRDGIVANMKDGVLEVSLPKVAPQTKKISVAAK